MSGTTFYADVLATVERLIAQYGETTSILKMTQVAGSKPWRPGDPTTTTYLGKGVFFPNGLRGPFRLARRPKLQDVAGSDIVCYVPGNIVPEPYRILDTDRVERADGSVWNVRFADYLEPAGTVMYYELRLWR